MGHAFDKMPLFFSWRGSTLHCGQSICQGKLTGQQMCYLVIIQSRLCRRLSQQSGTQLHSSQIGRGPGAQEARLDIKELDRAAQRYLPRA